MLRADFPGADFPVGSRVRFPGRRGPVEGVLTALGARHGQVSTADGAEWRVPWALLELVGEPHRPEVTLAEVEALGAELLGQYAGRGRLDSRWIFGFDLARVRAGACDYTNRTITLSVSYCQRASLARIRDTILHEMAHAICGPNHHHDETWRRVANSIGSSGDRCHRVEHTTAGWTGACGCGRLWSRHRLGARMRSARCAACGNPIRWRRTAAARATN